MKQPLPQFASDEEAIAFFDEHDLGDYFEPTDLVVSPSMPNLKFSTQAIGIRLPVSMLNQLKMLANKRDVPYQSLLKDLLAEKLAELTHS